ncbi:MAG: hypothetical protein IPL26_28000 [Leptospiraceae bacterium]|nr:hypothetical protein [Leptospiraceae bacterium]
MKEIRILDKTNQSINSIVYSVMHTARCHHQVHAWLTRTQSFLFKKEMIIAIA